MRALTLKSKEVHALASARPELGWQEAFIKLYTLVKTIGVHVTAERPIGRFDLDQLYSELDAKVASWRDNPDAY